MQQQTIIRTQKDKDNPYSMIHRGYAQDSRLSWATRGMMTYLLTKPDGWTIQVQDLVNQGPSGRDAVYAMLREAREYGYMERKRERNEKGQLVWGPYILRERPLPENPYMDKPYTAEPDMGEPDTAKPDVLKNSDSFLNNSELLESSESVAQAQPPTRPQPEASVPDTDTTRHDPQQPPLFDPASDSRSSAAAPKTRAAKKERDPLLDHPAVQAYKDVLKTNANDVQRALIAEHVSDLTKWRASLEAWAGHGWNPKNVAGLIEYHQNGNKSQHDRTSTPRAPQRTRNGSRPPIDPSNDGLGPMDKEKWQADMERRTAERAARRAARQGQA
jgi:hypothetical protein